MPWLMGLDNASDCMVFRNIGIAKSHYKMLIIFKFCYFVVLILPNDIIFRFEKRRVDIDCY